MTTSAEFRANQATAANAVSQAAFLTSIIGAIVDKHGTIAVDYVNIGRGGILDFEIVDTPTGVEIKNLDQDAVPAARTADRFIADVRRSDAWSVAVDDRTVTRRGPIPPDSDPIVTVEIIADDDGTFREAVTSSYLGEFTFIFTLDELADAMEVERR